MYILHIVRIPTLLYEQTNNKLYTLCEAANDL